MKKTLSLILACVLTVLSLASCIQTYDGTVTVVIGTETPSEHKLEFKTEQIENGLLSVLDLLEIEYEEVGGFLNSVGELRTTPPEYVYIYTSVAEDMDVSTWATSMEYKGTTLGSAGVGAKQLHITDGAIIYIGTIVY